MKNLLKKILNLLNVHPDKNQRWILLSLFLSGLLITYVHPAIVKEVYTNLPAEWIAFESLSSSVAGLVVGMLWKGSLRKGVTKNFLIFAVSESVLGCLLGLFLAFIHYNVWIFAVASLVYSAFITTFVGKCIMAFKAKLWIEREREIYDNNQSVVLGIVCVIGFSLALFFMPSLKLALVIWGLCCIIDDAGWIFVYLKNREALRSID
jgi:hypothetical protein